MSNVSGCRVEHFDVDFGVLQIFGPTLQQDRTCVSSMACQISGIEGTGLGSGDSLMLLETCSSGAMLDGLPAVPSSTLSGSSFDWTANLTEIVMSSPGGLYRLCWCMRGYPCDLIEHFVVDMGALHVIGPAPLTQHRTCYSGQSCLLDGLVQIGSTDLAKILVLETCGTSALIRPPSGHAIPSGSDTSGRADVTGQVRFAAGGLYRLCWCGQLLQDANTTGILGNASGQCKLAQNFGVDMGGLTMLGPAPLQQDRTCVWQVAAASLKASWALGWKQVPCYSWKPVGLLLRQTSEHPDDRVNPGAQLWQLCWRRVPLSAGRHGFLPPLLEEASDFVGVLRSCPKT